MFGPLEVAAGLAGTVAKRMRCDSSHCPLPNQAAADDRRPTTRLHLAPSRRQSQGRFCGGLLVWGEVFGPPITAG